MIVYGGEWRFEIMLNTKTFFIPNWLDCEGRKLPVNVIGGKPTCWYCVESSHHCANCMEKKAPEKALYHMKNSLPPTMTKGKKEAPVVLFAVVTIVPTPVKEKNIISFPLRLYIYQQRCCAPPKSWRESGWQ